MNVIVNIMNVSFIKKGQTVGRNSERRRAAEKKYPGLCDSKDRSETNVTLQ